MIAVRETGGAIVVEIDGEFAERTAEEFNAVITSLLEEERTQVVLNLVRAQWTSLRALKWLVAHLRKLRSRNGDLKLAGPNEYLENLLELTGTKKLFNVYPTVEDAVASLDLVVAAAAK